MDHKPQFVERKFFGGPKHGESLLVEKSAAHLIVDLGGPAVTFEPWESVYRSGKVCTYELRYFPDRAEPVFVFHGLWMIDSFGLLTMVLDRVFSGDEIALV